MQTWESANIFVFVWKYVEDFTLKKTYFLTYAHVRREKFVYKHSEAIERVKN